MVRVSAAKALTPRAPASASVIRPVPGVDTLLGSSTTGYDLARNVVLTSNPDQEGKQTLIETLRTLAQRSSPEEEGQGLAEYALILALIAVVAILSMIFLGETIADLMDVIGSTIDSST